MIFAIVIGVLLVGGLATTIQIGHLAEQIDNGSSRR